MIAYALFMVVAAGIVFLLWALGGITRDMRTAKQRKNRVLAHQHPP